MRIQSTEGTRINQLFFNFRKSKGHPLADARVREALTYAIDGKALVDDVIDPADTRRWITSSFAAATSRAARGSTTSAARDAVARAHVPTQRRGGLEPLRGSSRDREVGRPISASRLQFGDHAAAVVAQAARRLLEAGIQPE